jgi:type I restriction enzyme S subunit
MTDLLPLGELADVNPESLGASTTPSDFEFRYIDLGSVSHGSIDWGATSVCRFGSAPSRARRLLRDGDVLFGTVRPSLRSHAALRSGPYVCVASTGFAVVRARNGVSDPRFLAHYLLSDACAREARRVEVGSNYPAVNESDVRRFGVPCFPLFEQRRIAEILDRFDDAIAASERSLAKEHQLLLGLIDEGIRAAASDPHQVRRLGELVDADPAAFIQTGPFGSQLHAWEYQAGGVPVFMPQDIVDGELQVATAAKVTPQKAASLSRHILREGDVIVGRRGDLTRCATAGADSAGGLCGSGSLLIRPPRGVTGTWLAMVYRHDFVQRQIAARAVGSTMMNLSAGLIRALRVPLPGLNERATIERSVAALTSRIVSESSTRTKLRALRAGIADDLLTGRVQTVPA